MDQNKELLKGTQWLEEFEGYRSEIYLDTENIETVGIGRNLEVFPFDDEELSEYNKGGYELNRAVGWAYEQLALCRQGLIFRLPWICTAPPTVRLVLTDMSYNLGLTGLLGFKNMLLALKMENYKQGALELQDSKYFKQTGQRALHHYRELLNLAKENEDSH